MKTLFPPPKEAYHSFKHIGKKCPVDVVMVVDFECILQQRVDEEHKIQRHVPSQAAVLSVCTFGSEEKQSRYLFDLHTGTTSDFTYNAEGELESNVGEWCVNAITGQRNRWIEQLQTMNYPIDMTPESEERS